MRAQEASASAGWPIRTVEFFGVCGSGKSTLAHLVADRLSRQLSCELGVARLPPRSFLECIRSAPTATASLVLRSRRITNAVIRPGAPRSLVLARLRQEVAGRRQAHPLAVFQEGTVAAVWRTLVRHPTAAAPSLVRALLPAADLTVILEVPPAVAHQRIIGKAGPGPLNRLLGSSPLDGPLWQRAMEAHVALTEMLHEVGATTITLDNSATPAPEEVVRALLPSS